MGFGSYDESEQENQKRTEDDDAETVNVHENEHEGEVNFESNATTSDLIDKLGEIKETDEE